MKKLFIIPVLFSIFCITPLYANDTMCTDGDVECETKRGSGSTPDCNQDSECRLSHAEIQVCQKGRCVAKKCNAPYRLWFYQGSSMGICYSETKAKAYCKENCKNNEQDCEPRYDDSKMHENRQIKAFVGCYKKAKNTSNTNVTTTVTKEQTQTTANTSPAPQQTEPQSPTPKPTGNNKTNNNQYQSQSSVSIYCTTYSCSNRFSFDTLDWYLDTYFSESSNWKDEQGNFNTARLVSDSIAGVVLGSVGGIVTSKIIKNNQIKKGFDDLKCTIGGQTVATYGDEFTVGLR